jgi:hypothetical protein
MVAMKFGRRQSPEPEPVPVPPPSYDPASGSASTPAYPQGTPFDQFAGVPPVAADVMPPGFPPALGGGVPGGFPNGFGGMPGGFPGGFGGGMPGGFSGADGLAQLTAATQNPRVLDALVRSGKFRTREDAQAWLSQMVAKATQSAAQRGAMGGMQPGWGTGQQLPGAGQQTFQDLMDQSKKNRDEGRGN